MKKVLAMAAVAALAAGVSAYAANPFSDVSTSDWAYQAVSTLSDQGVVEGYPDGTFKGQNNITRYEMAQIVARLLAKEDQLNAEQKATVDKLAGEYADELDNLGVRVSNLEKKVGNLSFSGDARLRFTDNGGTSDQKYTGRVRVNLKGQVNDSTYVLGRLTSDNVDLKGGATADVTMDRLYVHHDFGVAGVTLGRYEVDAGDWNAWLFSQAFDGAETQFKLGDKVDVKAGYGRFNDNSTGSAKNEFNDYKDAEFFYAQAKADLGVATLGVDYFKGNDAPYTLFKKGDPTATPPTADVPATTDDYEVIGANVKVPVGDFRVVGDYYVNTTYGDNPTIWAAGVGYGKLDLKKPGSFGLDVAYFDAEPGVYLLNNTGWQVSDAFLNTKGSFWYATGDVALAKNTFLHAEYAFASDVDNGADLDDAYTVSLNYKF